MDNTIDFAIDNRKISFAIDVSSKVGFSIETGKIGFTVKPNQAPGFDIEDQRYDFETDLSYSAGGSVIPSYRGAYVVIPKSQQQKLLTNGLKMLDDVTVQKIPYQSVSNEYDGKTITIGG